MIRRRFLTDLSVAGLISTFHPPIIQATEGESELPKPRPDGEARIRNLRLKTAAPLEKMKEFYCDVIGMPLVAERHNSITLGAGPSRITYDSVEDAGDNDPFYHVAFNIPQNKHDTSKDWLIKNQIGIHQVSHFRSWNAHAVFFLDPADNLLEFIARHDLKNAASGGFAPQEDILCASEIAFLVDDVPSFSSSIKSSLGLEDYRPGTDQYATPGDEHGLLLVFKRGRMWHKPAEPFPATVTIAGKSPARFESADYPYQIRSA